MNRIDEKRPQAVLSDFKQFAIIAFMIIQLGSTLVIVISQLVQNKVITDEIYSVLFQRILVFLLDLIRLLFL